jgi:hypothetical protein
MASSISPRGITSLLAVRQRDGAIKRHASFCPRSRERRGQTESDERATRYIPLRTPQAHVPAEMLCSRAGSHGPHGITAPAHHGKQDSQFEDLQRCVTACRIYELRQKRQKEQRGLGVQQVNQHSLSKNPRQPRLAACWLRKLRIVASQGANAKINQVCRSEILDGLKSQR